MFVNLLALFIFVGIGLEASPTGFIYGGTEAVPGQFPFIVSTRINQAHWCGGAIFKENWIITSADCVSSATVNQLSVLIGSINRDSGGIFFDIDEVKIHPEFDASSRVYDVALLRTTVEIVWTDTVRPIVLREENLEPGELAAVAGWGWSATGESLNLKFTAIEIQKECPYPGTTLGCGLPLERTGICTGDEGGPVVISGFLVGIVSFTEICGDDSPDVFTRVSDVKDWIEANAV